MHILFFAAFYHPHRGGYELYVEEIATRLARNGHRVTVVTCNTEGVAPRELVHGVEIIRLPCWNFLGGTYPVPTPSRALFGLWSYVRRQGVTAVNTQTRFFMTSVVGWLIAKTSRRPLLHTEHGTKHVVLPSRVPRWISFIFDHTLGWMVTASATVVMAGSRAAGEFARHLGARSYDVVYNGVDTAYFRPRAHPSGRQTILFVGRLIAAKGVQDLLTAYLSDPAIMAQADLVIVGQGNYQSELETIGRSHPQVRFLGVVSREQLLAQYQAADIFVNPSYAEGLPTSVLEALATNCRVIATDVGGTSEIAATVHTTADQLYLYQPHDVPALREALRKVLSVTHPAVPVDMTPFSWDYCAHRFATITSAVSAA